MSSARTHVAHALSRYTNVHARRDSCADALLPYHIHTRSTVCVGGAFPSEHTRSVRTALLVMLQ